MIDRKKAYDELQAVSNDAAELLLFLVKRNPRMTRSLARGLTAIANDLALAVDATLELVDDLQGEDPWCAICEVSCEEDERLSGTPYYVCLDCLGNDDDEIQNLIISMMIEGEQSREVPNWEGDPGIGAASTSLVVVQS